MCILSDKIKFCTCASDFKVESLPQYWVLYRKAKKESFVLGSLITSTFVVDKDYKENNGLLLTALKSGSAFDSEMKFNEGDCLEVIVNNQFTTQPKYQNGVKNAEDEDQIDGGLPNIPTERRPYIYTFIFQNQKWIAKDLNGFEIENSFNEIKHGYFVYK